MKAYINAFKKYAVFKGRSTRKEFWMFYLVNLLVLIGLSFIGSEGGALLGDGLATISNFFVGLYAIFFIVPLFAVACRRLHDTDRTGWWILIGLIPFIGGLFLLFFLANKGTDGENKYGKNLFEHKLG